LRNNNIDVAPHSNRDELIRVVRPRSRFAG